MAPRSPEGWPEASGRRLRRVFSPPSWRLTGPGRRRGSRMDGSSSGWNGCRRRRSMPSATLGIRSSGSDSSWSRPDPRSRGHIMSMWPGKGFCTGRGSGWSPAIHPSCIDGTRQRRTKARWTRSVAAPPESAISARPILRSGSGLRRRCRVVRRTKCSRRIRRAICTSVFHRRGMSNHWTGCTTIGGNGARR